jgi:dolichol-phosphate mannosyltransferase
MNTRLFIIIPVYNESKNIQNLLDNIQNLKKDLGDEYFLKVITVDDGSIDDTKILLGRPHHPDMEVLVHQVNIGPGGAFRTAFQFLAPIIKPDDWVVTMEGDNTSSFKTLKQMLTRRKEGYEVVLASVYSYGGYFINVTWWRQALSYAANLTVLSVLRIYGIKTLSSFFRLHSGKTIIALQALYGSGIIELNGFGWAVEMLYKMVLINTKISELETTVDWHKRDGLSKMKMVKTMREYLRILLTHRKWKSRINEI